MMKSTILELFLWCIVASSVAARFGQPQHQTSKYNDEHDLDFSDESNLGYASQTDAIDAYEAKGHKGSEGFGHGKGPHRGHNEFQAHSGHDWSYRGGSHGHEAHPKYGNEDYGSKGSGGYHAKPFHDAYDYGNDKLNGNSYKHAGLTGAYPQPTESESTEPTEPTSTDTGTISPGPDSTSTTPTTDTSTSSTTSLAPTFTEILCPEVDLQCVDNFYVGCSKKFNQINPSQQSRTKIEGVQDARICHQRCLDDPTCTAWEDSDMPYGQYGECYHHHEVITLNLTAPYVASSLGVDSFGVRNYCQLSPGPLDPIPPPFAPATTTVVTIPTSSSSDLCPSFDNQCLNGLSIFCDRSLTSDAVPNPFFGCSIQFDITTERQCHEACAANRPACRGWQVYPDGDCCHITEGFVSPMNPLPPKTPDTVGYSFASNQGCTTTADDILCGEDQCTDGIRVQCRRDLSTDAATGISDAVGTPNVRTVLACQQACAEDDMCHAWYGYIIENEFDSGLFSYSFGCFRLLNRTITLRSDRPAGPPNTLFATYYGIKGLC
ncbi:hypothetical protein PFICI_12232 [Pestalotiopsis fici W106-1]|uniref:Apple domain-containing protein n=1 Tax=Pestalotiopsis fici (strain W106-1 / CGMCC3.15140) TaxID=1229662 RepID=W3WN59_PESFW|nr:uncharacterized protein PFICI_12232 [Pestalotiopsis fici W106-1]ETS75288.1 hypothetical protein PFICI_12232 [Pestalotiopsis fici W106-1]